MDAFQPSIRANGKTKGYSKWRWTRKEDNLLRALVRRYGPRSWDLIADNIPGRTGKSCRIRWMNQLNPKVDKSPFSEQEQQRIIQLQREFGNKWSTIASFFPGRTDNHVKNQYHALVGTRNKNASGPSSSVYPPVPLQKGSPMGLPPYGSVIGSQFPNVPPRGNNCFVIAPCFTAMPDRPQMMPLFVGGLYCRDKSFVAALASNMSGRGPHSFRAINLGTIRPSQRMSHGDSVMANANSATLSELYPNAQPQQGVVGTKDYQFIDFMGVGTSE
ncbi:Transcription factor [Sesamum alatum]|uniref:Transcription factor n=1 Tax=Sesamum alatum TaxID=300844 RepID=A0AAE2CC32_9LAMI|nr:Transcription factor [Sesamum alatum]